jgi:hypothetical protein
MLGWTSWQGASQSTCWGDEFNPRWGSLFAGLLGQTLGQSRIINQWISAFSSVDQRLFIGGVQKTAKNALPHPISRRFFAARNMVDIPTWFSTSGLAERGAVKIPLLRSIKKRSKSPAVYARRMRRMHLQIQESNSRRVWVDLQLIFNKHPFWSGLAVRQTSHH